MKTKKKTGREWIMAAERSLARKLAIGVIPEAIDDRKYSTFSSFILYGVEWSIMDGVHLGVYALFEAAKYAEENP